MLTYHQKRSSSIHLRAISQEIPQPSITKFDTSKISLKSPRGLWVKWVNISLIATVMVIKTIMSLFIIWVSRFNKIIPQGRVSNILQFNMFRQSTFCSQWQWNLTNKLFFNCLLTTSRFPKSWTQYVSGSKMLGTREEHFCFHYGVIKWKHFSRWWPFVRGIHHWWFLWCHPKQSAKQILELPVRCNAMMLIVTSQLCWS